MAVAMSGGVDSAVAAGLLVRRGHDVEGISLRLWRQDEGAGEESLAAARAVCAALGIRHRVLDLRELFFLRVVAPFGREYARGRTPNPCLACNELIKFGALRRYALGEGFDILATGHYARIDRSGPRPRLLAGTDADKDQSYFLYALGQGHLATLSFPVGALSKGRVRALAESWKLPVAGRPESQDVCFLPDGDYRRLVVERHPESAAPGPIMDAAGRLLGEHRGLAFYTVGQRSGLRISAERPLYVLELDVARNALVVGHAEELGSVGLIAEGMSYVCGEPPETARRVLLRIRHRAPRVEARIWPLEGGRALVRASTPLRDVTPGQAAVLYDSDEVLGGGIIAGAVRA